MKWRFTLIHDETETSQEISEPGGWKDHKRKFERHPEFFSLVESIDCELTFYGDNGTVNGGVDFIKNIESNYGFDANLRLFIELADDDVNFTDYWDGMLPLDQLERHPDNTVTLPLLPNNMWAKMLNRWDTPVDVTSTITLDSNECEAGQPITVHLTPQILRKTYKGRYRYAYELGQPEDNGFEYAQVDFELEEMNELTESKRLVPRILTNDVEPIFIMDEPGVYDFDVKITLGHNAPIDPNFCQSTLGKYVVYIQVNNDIPTLFTGADVTHGSDVVTEWTFSDSLVLIRSDEVRIYIEDIFDSSTDQLFIFGDEGLKASGAFQYGESYMNVLGKTKREATDAQGFLIHDLISAVLTRILT